MKQSKTIHILCLILCTMVFSLTTKAQTFVNWTSLGGTPNTWSGSYPGGTVTITQGATGNNITNFTPVNYTNLNGAAGSQGIAMNGPSVSSPSRSLIFTFSTPIIIDELTITDIDLGASWNDAFTFSGVTFSSVIGQFCNRTTTSATPTFDSGASAEWARWSTSTTPVTSFTMNFATTGGRTHALLHYSMKVSAAPCNAVTTAPTLSTSTITNVCPATTVDLTTITASNLPASTTLTWHTATPATTANKITTPSAVAAGTYYAAFFDATNDCYSGTGGDGSATTVVTATTTTCAALTANNPTTQTVSGGQVYTGNAGTELAPTGGTGPYTYSNGSSDPACINPGGATALPPASNLTVTNSTTGAYTYTAPTVAGTYFFCIKVCDSTSPTPNCVVKTYTVVVPCAAGSNPPVLIKN